jgi:two-component system LytT family sensor kinase
MKRTLLTNRWLLVLIHILVWGVVVSLPYLTYSGHPRPHPQLTSNEQVEFFRLNVYGFIFWIIVFYWNAYYLIPSFFNRRKYWLYLGLLFLTFFFVLVFHYLLFRIVITDVAFSLAKSVTFNFPAYFLVVAVSLAFRMAMDRMRSDSLRYEKEKEHMKTELSFLRSQISPHFILNVLNNIVALNRLKSEELEPTLLKLSGLLQYMLYQTDEEKVAISAEVDYIKSYVDLQQQRFGNTVDVRTEFNLAAENLLIEPMLLIPFIENAFKHGIGMIHEPFISIQLSANSESELFFKVKNKYRPNTTEIKDKTSGIGLNNVEKRLNILYGNFHSLDIRSDHEIFEISLYINLGKR